VSIERKVTKAIPRTGQIIKVIGDNGRPVFGMDLVCEVDGAEPVIYTVKRQRKKDILKAVNMRLTAAAAGSLTALYKEETGEHWGFSEIWHLAPAGQPGLVPGSL
jgi:hypothetical protein